MNLPTQLHKVQWWSKAPMKPNQIALEKWLREGGTRVRHCRWHRQPVVMSSHNSRAGSPSPGMVTTGTARTCCVGGLSQSSSRQDKPSPAPPSPRPGPQGRECPERVWPRSPGCAAPEQRRNYTWCSYVWRAEHRLARNLPEQPKNAFPGWFTGVQA